MCEYSHHLVNYVGMIFFLQIMMM